MRWADYPDATIAETVCTQAEIEVLILKIRGLGRRAGSRMLGISESAWRYRMENALRKINAEKRKAA
jgi:DNA-binding CsgD family transcriptional regulator